MPSIHSSVSTPRAVRSQSTVGTRKSGSSLTFSRISAIAAASSRRSISIVTERASVSTTSTNAQPPRLGRMALGVARREVERVEIAPEAPLDAGPQHLHGDRLPVGLRRDAPARSMRPRPRGRTTWNASRQRHGERGRDRGFGLGLRKRRHLVLQRFRGRARARGRPRRAASRGTGRASRRSVRAASARPTA